ncbi:hypothetical protein Ddc_07554 [Ditylenchus destructor]|nr:hypothetical protein Ddc_07554 [Ditylenchus destructor]
MFRNIQDLYGFRNLVEERNFVSSAPVEVSPQSYQPFNANVPKSVTQVSPSPLTAGAHYANSLMEPLVQPFMKLFNFYPTGNPKSAGYADKALNQHRKMEAITPELSIFDKLFAPLFNPTGQHFGRSTEVVSPLIPRHIPPSLFSRDSNAEIRRSPPIIQTPVVESKGPLSSLLENIGMQAPSIREEVQVGRDRTISVLGMPVGQRNGFALSPLTGISLGNQDMFGPIAVNDRYNVKWDFLDKLGAVFAPPY